MPVTGAAKFGRFVPAAVDNPVDWNKSLSVGQLLYPEVTADVIKDVPDNPDGLASVADSDNRFSDDTTAPKP